MDPMHPYERIPLFTAGLVLALWLIASHALMLAQAARVKGWLKSFQRNPLCGQILLGIGLAWFWLLVAEPGPGVLRALAMDLGEFNGAKPVLRILVPAALFGVAFSVRDFLAVRALGLIGLMAAAPLLDAAFLKDPASRLLIPIYAYAMLTASMFLVGMPYLFRDAIDWLIAVPRRWTAAAMGGLLYGVATLACALLYWRGY
jgi:hypothetical protein